MFQLVIFQKNFVVSKNFKLAATSFPLCMKNIHNRLRRDHHLRHGARMQYGLFLKAVGMTLEDALLFWRTEFSKKMDSDKVCQEEFYLFRREFVF